MFHVKQFHVKPARTRPDPNHHDDTPIAAAAERASRVLTPGGSGALPRPQFTRIITIANQKGGVGKTTTAVNMAAALAVHRLRVLVIDLDPQGNASTALGVDHRSGIPSVYELLIGEVDMRRHDRAELQQREPLLRPGNAGSGGSGDRIGVDGRAGESSSKCTLDKATLEKYDFDFVLIDCPPSLGLLTINAMVAAREVMIPIQCEYYALEGVSQLLSNINLVQAHLNPELHVSTVVLTMYDGRTKLADQVAESVREHFGDRVLNAVIPRSVKVSEAPGYGTTSSNTTLVHVEP